MQKRILFLGGSHTQIPPIKYAKEQGHYVIICDYLPDNPGQKYADQYYNISTTDKEAVLELAKKLNLDGIVAYAAESAAPTQAYVGNKLGLPSNPYESVQTLVRKDLFRAFQKKHDFNTPKSKSFNNLESAQKWFYKLDKPVIVKPIDSSGSRGVVKISNKEELKQAFINALEFSKEKKVVVEEFVIRDGYQVCGDGFVVDGKLVFQCWANEHFDILCNNYAPIGESFPSVMTKDMRAKAHAEAQRLLSILGIKTGALNFDFHYDKKGNFSFIEIGPRNGGNLIPEVIRHATDVDLIRYTVDAALGLDCASLKMTGTKGFYSSYTLHALANGIIKDIWYNEDIKHNIIDKDIYCDIGQKVHKYDGAHHTVGRMIMKFTSQDEMLEKMNNMEKYIRVIVE